MKAPQGGDGTYDRFCRWLDGFYKRGWVQYLLAPALVAVPPWLVTKALDSKPLKEWLQAFSPVMADVLTRYDVLFFGFASIYAWAVLAFGKSVSKRVESRSLDIAGLLTLLASIDQVVGSKLDRFRKHVNNVASLKAETAFDAITQPRLQISELTRGIADFFNASRPGKGNRLIRVVLVEMSDRRIKGIAVYFPMDEPVKATIDDLSKPNSTIMTAFKSRRIVVIESIKKELKKRSGASYVDAGNEQDNNGSLICFPVVIPQSKNVPYVVSVHCDEDGYFKKAMSELYEHSLARFALRLNLEHGLLELKEKLCEH